MKLKIVLFIILLLSGCKKNNIIDIEEPVLENIFQTKKGLFLQFNEPVKLLKFHSDEQTIDIENIFPVANNLITLPAKIRNNKIIFSLEAEDNSGNTVFIKNKSISINIDPVKIKFISVNLKYSKKKKQFISFKTLNRGDINGFAIIFFQNKKQVKISFSDEHIPFIKNFYISIDKLDKGIEPAKNESISFSKNQEILLKNRLSKISGLIVFENNNEEIEDYFLYYNLKEHDKEYYDKNKTFNYYKSFLSSNSIENPFIRDIAK